MPLARAPDASPPAPARTGWYTRACERPRRRADVRGTRGEGIDRDERGHPEKFAPEKIAPEKFFAPEKFAPPETFFAPDKFVAVVRGGKGNRAR